MNPDPIASPSVSLLFLSTPRGMKSVARNGPTFGIGTVTRGRAAPIGRTPTSAGATRWAALRKLADSDSA